MFVTQQQYRLLLWLLRKSNILSHNYVTNSYDTTGDRHDIWEFFHLFSQVFRYYCPKTKLYTYPHLMVYWWLHLIYTYLHHIINMNIENVFRILTFQYYISCVQNRFFLKCKTCIKSSNNYQLPTFLNPYTTWKIQKF